MYIFRKISLWRYVRNHNFTKIKVNSRFTRENKLNNKIGINVYFRQTSKQNLLEKVMRKLQISHLLSMGKKLLLEKTIFMNVVSVAQLRVY
jgi:hypothetical protein